MIKVLYLPLNYGEVIQDGVYDGFRENRCHLEVFDYMNMYLKQKNSRNIRNALISKAKTFRPDLIFMQIQHTNVIDGGTVGRIKKELPNTIIVNWTGDVRNYVPATYKRVAMASDYNLISSTAQIPMFKNQLKKDIKYLQIGFNPKLYYPSNVDSNNFKYDAIFIGNHSPRERYPGAAVRINTCRQLRKAFGSRFCLFGSNWPKDLHSRGSLDQRKVRAVYQTSLCLISISHFNDLSHYFSDRLLMSMASGRPVVSLKFPKYESYFTNNCDLVIADNADDIIRKVKMLKNNIALANYIGESGAAKVMAEHTYASRINELLHIVGLR